MLKEEILKLINLAAENLGYTIYEASLYLKGPNTKITVKMNVGNASYTSATQIDATAEVVQLQSY